MRIGLRVIVASLKSWRGSEHEKIHFVDLLEAEVGMGAVHAARWRWVCRGILGECQNERDEDMHDNHEIRDGLTDANGNERKGIGIESDWDGRILSIPGWWCRMEADAFRKGKFRSATTRDLMLAGF